MLPVLVALAFAQGPASAPDSVFETPFRLSANERAGDHADVIDVGHGHAAPLVADVDGDGRPELLVGQYADGLLRAYRIEGAARARTLTRLDDVKAGDKPASVPTA